MKNTLSITLLAAAGSLLLIHGASEQARGQDRPAGVAEITGTVTFTSKASLHDTQTPPAGPAAYGTDRHGAHKPTPIKLSEKTVIYIESEALALGHYTPPQKHPTLDQRDLQFHPQVLPLLVGTTVDFPNRDNLFHNVFSYSPPREFDLGRYPRDDSRSVTFGQPGLVRVYCDIHAHMNATLLVLPHPFFTTPDDHGVYAIRQVPPGSYTIVLWFDRDAVERRTVVVKEGESLVVDFTL
jgi:hypothetical protein